MAAFDDRGICRPGAGVRRRPPSRATTSEAGEPTPNDEPVEPQEEIQPGGAQQSPGPPTPTTPGTDATEVSGSVSVGGTYHLRGDGQRPLPPVPEHGGGIPKAAPAVGPPLPTAWLTCCFAGIELSGAKLQGSTSSFGTTGVCDWIWHRLPYEEYLWEVEMRQAHL